MTAAGWLAVLGVLAWVPGIWGIVEGIRKRRSDAARALDEGDRMVVKSAVELLAPYRSRVEELESKLAGAEHTVEGMATQLAAANKQVTLLTEQLGDAQAEVRILRAQVKALSAQLPDQEI